jgi:PKD repeat protein
MKKSTKLLSIALMFLGLGAFAQAPVANFSWSPTNPCPGQTVQVTDMSTGNPVAWVYSVTGASQSTYAVQNPVVTFTTGGTQTIIMICAGLGGTSTPVSKTVSVTPNPLGVTSTTANLCSGQSATLTATGGTAFTWAPVTSTVASVVISPTVTSNYTVTSTGTTCPSWTWTAVFTQSVQTCGTGVVKNAASGISFNLYPNPTNGDFTIELNNGTTKTIEILDMTGRMVYTSTTSSDKVNCNLSALAKGIYYVRVQSNNSIEVAKIVKQ